MTQDLRVLAPQSEAGGSRASGSRSGFAALKAEWVGRPGISLGRRMGIEALSTGAHIFAMEVDDALVVKLPAARVAGLVSAGRARPYEPSPGQTARHWVLVAPGAADWGELASEAQAFVAAQQRLG